MKLKTLSLFVLLTPMHWLYSQAAPFAIASCGELSIANNISLEWSLGELSIESSSTLSKLYTQGSHQPLVVVPVSKHLPAEAAGISSGALVFPNPVKSFLNVKLNTRTGQSYVSLLDARGSILVTKVVSGKSEYLQIDMSKYPASVYLLSIVDSLQKTTTYKIIKVK